MNREEQRNFCSICTHQRKDVELGFVCGLTNQLPDFDTFCADFIEDTNKTVHNVLVKTRSDRSIRASRGDRFINSLIDSVALLVCFFLLAVIVSIIQSIAWPAYPTIFEDEDSVLNTIVAFVSFMFYYTLFEYKTGQTLGKVFTKTKVVTSTGGDPSLQTIIVRTLCRLIPFEDLSFLISNKSGWHDRLSYTKVVRV